ncbi:MAG: SsrA-binding protein SmpB [Planctomycetota bacterium]
MSASDKKAPPRRAVAVNKKARHEFEVLDTFEAGLVLRGTEVKSLRAGKISLEESWGKIENDEVFLVGAHIEEYTCGNRQNHDPVRRRKLLLRGKQIKKLKAQVTQKGLTLVPLDVFFNERGFAKVTLGLCRGKKLHDKREASKAREAKRAMRDAY